MDRAPRSRRAAQIVREGPISQRFSEMDAAHCILAIEVRKRASNPQNAVIAAGGKAHGVGRLAQQREPSRVGLDDRLQDGAAGLRVGSHREPERTVTLRLDGAGARNPRSHFGAAFGRRRQDQVGGGDGRHINVQVDAVKQRARQPRLIVGGAALIAAAFAGEIRFARASAAARVHGGDQHETGRVGDAPIGAGDRDFAGLQRLAKRVEHAGFELRQLVEKQDAVMGERYLARIPPPTRAGMLAE